MSFKCQTVVGMESTLKYFLTEWLLHLILLEQNEPKLVLMHVVAYFWTNFANKLCNRKKMWGIHQTFSRKSCGQGERTKEKYSATVAIASKLCEWTLSRRVCCKGTSCSWTRLKRSNDFQGGPLHTYRGHEGIQLTQMGCVRNSNPGTNRHEPVCFECVTRTSIGGKWRASWPQSKLLPQSVYKINEFNAPTLNLSTVMFSWTDNVTLW